MSRTIAPITAGRLRGCCVNLERRHFPPIWPFSTASNLLPRQPEMEIIRTVAWMKQIGRMAQREDCVLGFVPTMGALHEGHFSLIRAAQKECAPVVVSIFINPTQFGTSEDLQKYPRTFEADRAALEALGVDYLF